MYRKALQELIYWKNKPNRMPLLIEGARQVGKTWLMKEFGLRFFKKTIYINFDLNPKIKELFQDDINPRRIIAGLEFMEGKKIESPDTLIIFNEIQECNQALVSLKYFCEDAPEYTIISAGSLLGVAIHKGNSFPVGKAETLKLYPLSFSEFLEATAAPGDTRYKAGVEKGDFFAFHLIETDLIARLKQYYFIGGMPKAVLSYIEPRSARYSAGYYRQLRTGFFQTHKCLFNSQSGHAYEQDAFKLYLLDVGLLSAMAGLSLQNLADPNTDLFTHFKGALTEQFVLQELKILDSKPQIS
jgi:predicted AAA+ superfamily ATPase